MGFSNIDDLDRYQRKAERSFLLKLEMSFRFPQAWFGGDFWAG
jgi:hypothetical protein